MTDAMPLVEIKRSQRTNDVLPTFGNCLSLLRRTDFFDGMFRFNEFSGNLDMRDPETGDVAPVTDADLSQVREFFWATHSVDFSADTVHKAIAHIGSDNAYHPVRDYLHSTTWDGVERVRYLLTNYIGATDDLELNEALSVRWMVGGVARVMQPGCKLDTMLVLQGAQGARKSTALAILGSGWFSDAILDLRSKEASQQIEGVWIQELAEMESVRKQESSLIKAFLARRVERYRRPYARTVSVVQRQCIFAGTTNEGTFLSDKTGARRYWVRTIPDGVHVALDRLMQDRDQLWAEALHYYHHQAPFLAGDEPDHTGTQWWLTYDEGTRMSAHVDQFRVRDPWEDLFDDGKISVQDSTSADILDALEIPPERRNKTHEMRLSAILKARGFKKQRVTTYIGERARVWRAQ